MKRVIRALSFLAIGALLVPELAHAAEPERVVVRNRKFTTEGRYDAGLTFGFTPVNFLTSHYNLTGSVAYNFTEQFAFELGGGYALTSHTSVAKSAANNVVSGDPTSQKQTVDDFEDLWRMGWSLTGSVRWAPFYGKVNVAAELPLHFKAYLLAGAGVSGMEHDSVVYCVGSVSSRKTATCVPGESGANALTPLHTTAVKPIVQAGAGMRFFAPQGWGLQLEVRDVSFPDSFRTGIVRASAEKDAAALGGSPTFGKDAASPGLTHLVFVNVGAIYSF